MFALLSLYSSPDRRSSSSSSSSIRPQLELSMMKRQVQIILIILASTNCVEPALGFSSTVFAVRRLHFVDRHRRHRHHHGRWTRRQQHQQQLRRHAVNGQEWNDDITASDTRDVTLRIRREEAIHKLPNALCSIMLAVAVASTQLGPETTAVAAASSLSLPEISTTTSTPASSTTTTTKTAAQIHLNNFPPTTVSIEIEDLPVIGKLVSGTYAKTGDESLISKKIIEQKGSKKEVGKDVKTAPLVIRSPDDKVAAILMAGRGHFEFDLEGLIKTHLDVDVASEPGAAVIRVFSPIIPRLPFRNSASDLVPPAAGTLKKFRDTPKRQAASNAVIATPATANTSPTAAHIYLNSLPPAAVSVEIEDLFVLGKLLSGVYTKIDDAAGTSGSSDGSSNHVANAAAIVIESPKDKVSAIKNIASNGQLSFDVDGLVTTHVDVNIATDTQGSATILVTSPLIPALPFQNAASF